VKKGQRVLVKEGRVSWEGTFLWSEKGFGDDVWAVVQPDEYTVHARRGSGNREYSENLVRIPTFLNSVEPIEA
jgi:hypothetical protein